MSKTDPVRPVRVGIMSSTVHFPEWVADAVRFLAEVPGVEIRLVIMEGRRRIPAQVPPPRAVGLWARLWAAARDGSLRAKLRERLEWWNSRSLFARYRRWQISSGRLPTEKIVDLSGLFAGVPQIICNTRAKGRFAEVFEEEDVAYISGCQLDWIFKCGFNIIHGPILQAARFGIWSFHHDDHLRYRGGPPAYWEIVHGDVWTGAMLQRINEKLDDGLVLHKEWTRTEFHSYSFNLNRTWRSSSPWPALSTLMLQTYGSLEFADMPVRSDAPLYRAPTNRQILPFFVNLLGRKLKQRLVSPGPRREHWGIGIIDCGPEQFLQSKQPPPVRWITGRNGSYCADPFVLSKHGRDYLFYERFEQRGQIAVSETTDWIEFTPPKVVLGGDIHWSYPFVFEHEGRVYGLPEQCLQNQVVLYELCDFPGGWQKVCVILENFCGLDPTLFFHEGLWWLLVGEGTGVDHLHAFYAADLRGPWIPHRQNPVVSSLARRSRPAGRVFRSDQQLLRPAQYGHRYYGYGLLFYRIDRLTPDEYVESLLHVKLPDPQSFFPDGIHHFEAAGQRCLIDGQRHFYGKLPADLGGQSARL